jgi:diadenosine tetraphosphate (Ap4A) HIT family hydrolase
MRRALKLTQLMGNSSGTSQWKGVTYDSHGQMLDTLFAQICDGRLAPGGKDGGKLLHQDEQVVAFVPIGPASDNHLLVVSKRWIRNCNDLQPSDQELLLHMKRVGLEVLRGRSSSAAQTGGWSEQNVTLCFHRPPFNTIDHLHLHCVEHPKYPLAGVKYTDFLTPWCLPFDAAMQRLEQQQRQRSGGGGGGGGGE